ncbi:hypothetical protein FOZ63_029521 [Perkinsus olseni]|uniref:Uncharacterized protein n=1 Tax=Perkinsus olseni TaxID=32597 RepID=A0A7J6SBV8_PEROL|nr:hypothetical protein FOZ63_029521 [Perkinsus olseni]
MSRYLVWCGITFVHLVDAEEKYYCYFKADLLAHCIGRSSSGPVKTISQHGALQDPQKPDELVFTTDICSVQDQRPAQGVGGALYVDTVVPCDIEGLQAMVIPYRETEGSRIHRRPTRYHLTYPSSTGETQFDKLQPIAVGDLKLGRAQKSDGILSTFESHSPIHLKAVLTEINLPNSRPVVKATFKMLTDAGSQRELFPLSSKDGVMRLTTTEYHPPRVEAFFFKLPSRRENYYGLMITFNDEPIMLFNTSMRPGYFETHGYRRTERYPGRNEATAIELPPASHPAAEPRPDGPPSYEESERSRVAASAATEQVHDPENAPPSYEESEEAQRGTRTEGRRLRMTDYDITTTTFIACRTCVRARLEG